MFKWGSGMKKVILGIVILGSLTQAAGAAVNNAGKTYFHTGIGHASSSTKVAITNAAVANFNPQPYGIGFNLGMSYALTDSIRIGADALWMYHSRDKGSSGAGVTLLRDKVYMRQLGAFTNAYYDFRTLSRFTPYVTAGAGVLRIEMKDELCIGTGPVSSSSAAKIKAALQGGGGIAYRFSRNMDVEIGYRAISPYSRNKKKANSTSENIMSHNYTLNLDIKHTPAMTHLGFIGARVEF